MTLYAFTDKKVLTIREQLQEDLITLLDSQFGEVDYLDDVKDLACQIVNDNFANLIKWQHFKCPKVGQQLSLLQWKKAVELVLLESTFVVLIVEQSLAYITFAGVHCNVKDVIEWLISTSILWKQNDIHSRS